MIWPDNPLNKFPLLPRSCQKSEPQVNQISWMYWTFRVNSETKIKWQKNTVFFIKAISTRIPMFLKPEICFQSFFGKIRVFQSFSPIHKKTLIRWKFDSVIYGACAVWCMTLLVFVVFLSRRFFFFLKTCHLGTVWCRLPGFVFFWARHIPWLLPWPFQVFQDLRLNLAVTLKNFQSFPCFGVFLDL